MKARKLLLIGIVAAGIFLAAVLPLFFRGVSVEYEPIVNASISANRDEDNYLHLHANVTIQNKEGFAVFVHHLSVDFDTIGFTVQLRPYPQLNWTEVAPKSEVSIEFGGLAIGSETVEAIGLSPGTHPVTLSFFAAKSESWAPEERMWGFKFFRTTILIP